MTYDPTSLLRLGSVGARLVQALIVVTQVAFAVPTLHSVTRVWPVIVALSLFVAGSFLLAAPHPDPLPITWTVTVVAIGALITVIVEWNLSGTGSPGYAGWNFGAVTWLFFFLAFRGRIAAAWVGLALMAGLTIWWTTATGAGVLPGIDLVARHAGTLLIGSLFSALLRRVTARIERLRTEQLVQVATESAAIAELREREMQAAQLNTEARPVLELIARGAKPNAADRLEFRLVEASLRDSLRGGALATEPIAEAARVARLRGAEVVLLDDRNAPLDPGSAARVEVTVLGELATLRDGHLTMRLLPGDRETIATLVRNDGVGRSRVDIPRPPPWDGWVRVPIDSPMTEPSQ